MANRVMSRLTLLSLDVTADLARARLVGAALSGEHGWWGIAIAIGGALLYRIVVWTLSELRKP
jgi:hypothetical protein